MEIVGWAPWQKFLLVYVLLAVWFASLINYYSGKGKAMTTAVATVPAPEPKEPDKPVKKYSITAKMIVSFFYSKERGWQVIHWHTMPVNSDKELYEIEIPIPDGLVEEQLKERGMDWLDKGDKTVKP